MPEVFEQMKWVYPAVLTEIDAICGEARCFLEKKPISAQELFAAQLLMREALTNAVIHGCQGDPEQRVTCLLKINTEALVVDVKDPGHGFDWQKTLQKTTQDLESHGRGLVIYSLYATAFTFNRRGNRITLRRDLQKGNGHVR